MKHFITIFLLITVIKLFSQSRQIDLEAFTERIFAVQEDDLHYEDLYESLSSYYIEPLNLNKATREELENLYLLNLNQINALLEHRKQFGDLLSIYELQTIPEFDLVTIEKLLPFVQVNESKRDARPFLSRVLDKQRSYFLLRYSINSSTNTEDYVGSADHLYSRFRSNYKNDYSFGFTVEKDPGEAIWQDSIKGFDFFSFHFQLEERGFLKNLIIGDFQVQTGQGLVFGAGFSPGKGASISTVKRSNVGLRPYTSARETGFFRGVSGTIEKGSISFTSFISRAKQDARILNDSTDDSFLTYIQSIRESGFHRNSNELQARDQINEHSAGGIIIFEPSRKFNMGSSLLYTRYDRPLYPAERTYNQFEFKGKENLLTSVFFNAYLQNMMLFGEIARSSSGGLGKVLGMTAVFHPNLESSMIFREYDRNFHSFYGNGFGENSRNINEKGFYWGLSYSWNRKNEISGYLDLFSFPWLKFRVDAPSDGSEFLVRYTFSPSRDISTYIQVRNEIKERNLSTSDNNLPEIAETQKTNFVANAKYKINEILSMKTRIQYSRFKQENTTSGITLAQDIRLDFKKLRLTGRIALFDTDDFDNRQYLYENDVLYSFSIPAYYGTGTRKYLLAKYSLNKRITVWGKYGHYNFTEKSVNIVNNLPSSENELRFQVMIKF